MPFKPSHHHGDACSRLAQYGFGLDRLIGRRKVTAGDNTCAHPAGGVLTFSPKLAFQALQGVGRVPFLQGEPSKQAASHGEQHLSAVSANTHSNTPNTVSEAD
ncbi:hypothetical protein KUCAC02_027410 [Chaenocephalus aceratus]|uniref:Uncharacterized protein n=1 Tax=Chaenocephalus aceratus TaxID=36190 RepID=A0ACB9W3M8_CHAAC|nr:hypothetical protein KUCAC02_027410 [Chaenocephalus aceratus]